jgi:type I restriction enzyme, S subunit
MKNKGSATTQQLEDKSAFTPKLRFPEFRNTGDWAIKLLGDAAENLDNRRRPITSSDRQAGDVPYYGASGIVDYVEGFIFDEDLLCISEDGANLVARTYPIAFAISGKTWVNNHAHVLRFANPCTRKLVEHYLNSIKLDDFITGMAQPKLNKAMLDSIPIPYPDTPEQKNLADCLTSFDDLIAAQTQKLDALKTHKKGLMQQLFPREGETQPRLRFPEFRNAGEWISDALGQVFETSSGGTPDRAKEEYWNGSIPWITTSLVDFNIITQAGEYISDSGLTNSSAKLFPKETILVAMYGQGKTRGKVALLGLKATTNQACAAILPRQDINSRFVFANLSCRYDEMRRLSNTGGQENLSQGLIKELQFSYPKDANEQRRIADCFTPLDDLIAAQAQKLGDLKTHKNALMQQLFPVTIS